MADKKGILGSIASAAMDGVGNVVRGAVDKAEARLEETLDRLLKRVFAAILIGFSVLLLLLAVLLGLVQYAGVGYPLALVTVALLSILLAFIIHYRLLKDRAI